VIEPDPAQVHGRRIDAGRGQRRVGQPVDAGFGQKDLVGRGFSG